MKRAFTLLLLLCASGLAAQTVSDQGLMGVSGVVLFPTSTTFPKAQFRLSAGRMAFTGTGLQGLNVIGFGGGLSSHVEAYLRVHEDQSAPGGSLTSYAYGVKFRLPFALPLVEGLSLWAEDVTADRPAAGQLLPTNLVRTGATALLIQNGVRPQLFLGATFRDHHTEMLGGAGITVAMGHDVQLGAEALYGYAGPGSAQAMVAGSFRVLSGVCLQAGGGYLSVRARGTGIVSLGMSVGTADVDFAPVVEEKRPEFRMPTLEEMEQQSREEEKP